MSGFRRFLSVPTWLRMRLSGTSIANWYTTLNVWVYRATKGKLWAHLYVPDTRDVMPILLLETLGRRTGKLRVTPLIYCEQDGRFVLAAANAGNDRHPGWFVNLRVHADVHVCIGGDRFPAVAKVASPVERDAALTAFAAVYPPLRRYREATSREIPMVLIERKETSERHPPQ